jgi:uncharacterized protein
MNSKKTLVLGASNNPLRFAYKAIYMLKDYQHEVVAVGKEKAVVNEVEIQPHPVAWQDIDTVTLYINPGIQPEYYDYIVSLKPQRVIFNPGTENSMFAEILTQNNIEPIYACTLVMLRTGQY